MRRLYFVISVIGISMVLFGGCDSTGAGGDDNGGGDNGGVTEVAFSGLSADGTSGTTTTTSLTLTFDVDPTTLDADDITVSGATKGVLSGSGTTRTLAISEIGVANGEDVTVEITDPDGFTISPSSRTVAVNVEIQDGGVTVSLSGAEAANGETLSIWVYEKDEWNVDSPDTVLAAGSGTISDGSVSCILKQSDGSFGYTTETWEGSGGTEYDLYIMTDNDAGTNTKIYSPYPLTVLVDGDTTESIAYGSMQEYVPTTGTLTVTLSGAEAQDGETLVAGVWEEGGHPADAPPITGAEATSSISSGTAEVTILPWDGMVAETQYDVFIFIFTEGRSDGAPEPGKDYVYKSTSAVPWYVDSDRTMRPAYEDFILIPTE
jgi:hypothetical protein